MTLAFAYDYFMALSTQLSRTDDKLFIDLTALNIVRFDGDGKSATAYLKFKDGGSEIVKGESVLNLQQQLIALATIGEKAATIAATAHDVDAVSFDPASRPTHIDITAAPLLGRNKAWFYGKDKSGRGLILAFVNAKGSSSVRPFESETGIALGKRYGTGPYQEFFAELVEGATELTVDAQPNLERDCKQRLPERLFAQLQRQIAKIT